VRDICCSAIDDYGCALERDMTGYVATVASVLGAAAVGRQEVAV
jgi:hypothetical protein